MDLSRLLSRTTVTRRGFLGATAVGVAGLLVACGGGADFGTSLGGTAGGLHRTTIYLAIGWAVMALLLGLIPR